uniref:Uncharacterized protein AlNc14C107G6259 n=1 Tax=Albugo laibachii Nc14 TaxID=890382 RepID=F0WI52_9STRA|nr:conserved hypothetical protein [Albugo laibachii Nc14]|eukprot:CCA20930.1 conserved hypothetical protein [Albugo laibachii Nc14]
MRAEQNAALSHAFLADAALYSMIVFASSVQLTRNCWNYRPLTVQKMIHLFMFLGSLTRTIFLALVVSDWCDTLTGKIHLSSCSRFERETFYILDQFPILMYVVIYTMLIQFWAQVYYNATNNAQKLQYYVRPALNVWILCIILGQGILWILYATFLQRERNFVTQSEALLNLLMFTIITGAFVYFGRKAYLELRSIPIELSLRSRKMKELMIMTIACTSCFLTRSIMQLLISEETHQLHDRASWFIVTMYYGALELIPSITTLYYNRHIPTRRKRSNQDAGSNRKKSRPNEMVSDSLTENLLVDQEVKK